MACRRTGSRVHPLPFVALALTRLLLQLEEGQADDNWLKLRPVQGIFTERASDD